ncbi:MAG: exodeoxyribonuclease V subunit alpha [Lentisphaerae bacterium]|nr:exodeoxyribonuclease V subunit alpha [Lentisphaerota bacterium]
MPEKYDLENICRFVRQSNLFGQAAQVMGDFVLRNTQSDSPELYLAMVLAVQCSVDKHVCCKLPEYAGKTLVSVTDPDDKLTLPELNSFLLALHPERTNRATAFFNSGDKEKSSALLIIDEEACCYLQRQWSFEQSILNNLLDRANSFREVPELPAGYINNLIEFFPTAEEHPEVDYQQLAVMAAMRRKLLVLSGGPGTGKTTVAAAILASMLEQNNDLRIRLAAPTAKAAVRLSQSLQSNIAKLASAENIKEKLFSLESSTIHSLLGTRSDSREFVYNSQNYLNCDVLLIDECSMVSQDLMARTLEALSPDASLILAGDRYQLASVEAGAVMADICDGADPNHLDADAAAIFYRQTTWQVPTPGIDTLKKSPLTGALVELKENHRFARSAKMLGEVATLIRNLNSNSQDVSAVAKYIADSSKDEFEFKDLDAKDLKVFLTQKFSEPRLAGGETFADLPRLAASGNADDRNQAFELMDKLKILCPAYEGLRGLNNLNLLAMKILNLDNMYIPGNILLIKRNDYRIGLVNGDIGLVGKDANGHVKVFFAGKDHAYNISDLPEHEAAFAMTVHKSQGSGFSETIFIMPEKATELMTREMVYTAMTRAENKLCCIGSVEVFAEALAKVTVRMSNLANKLKNCK